MKHLLAALAFLVTTGLKAAPVPIVPKGPSQEATRQIEQRRERLRDLPVGDPSTPEPKEVEGKRERALDELAAALGGEDPYVLDEAVRDVVNNQYRTFDAERIVALLVLRMEKPESHPLRMTAQGWLMEVLWRPEYRELAKPAIPGLLLIIANQKATEYTRQMAAQAAGRIGTGDPTVLKAFSMALEHKEYPSAVLTQVAESAGEMGLLAAAVKPALVKLYERGDLYNDPAYVALGKIALDATPSPLADCLKRLGLAASLPPDQASAAFLDVVRLGKVVDTKAVRGSANAAVIDQEVVRVARPALLKVIRKHAHDAHSRAALRALAELGPGADPETAKVLTDLLVEYREAVFRLNEIRISMPPGPKRDAAQDAFSRLLGQSLENLVFATLINLEPSDPKSVTVLTSAFSKMTQRVGDWHVAAALASNLGRFGDKAGPAVLVAIKAIHSLRWTKVPDNTLDAFVAYLSVVTAGGGTDARNAVVGLLDPARPTISDSGPLAAEIQAHLLLTLVRIGLPVEADNRAVVLGRIEEGLASDSTVVFSAAAKVVAQSLSPAEAGAFVKPLARVLEVDFKFGKMLGCPHALLERFSQEERELLGQGLAVRALGAIGAGAKEALPTVVRISDRSLTVKASGFSTEPPENWLIREALEARKRIETVK